MASHDAGTPFKLVGGRLCLDFINTVSGRLPRPGRPARDYADVVEEEWLAGYGDLLQWGRIAGILSPTEADALARSARAAPAKASRVAARARELREAMYRIIVAVTRRWPPDAADVERLNRELARARTHERLTPDGQKFGSTWQSDAASLDRVLWPVVRSAAELLLSDDVERVHRCDGDDCRWLFFDTSRSRNRRWCDMADCGNVAKVRRYRGQAV